MQTCTVIDTRKTATLLVLLAAATSLLAQGAFTLIGPSIRNGGFEDGMLSPWTAPAGSVSVVQDSSFAAQGEWFVAISQTASGQILRPSIFQRVHAAPDDGLTFALTFNARHGTAAFDGIRVFFAAQNTDTTTVFATNSFFTLTSLEWEMHQTEFQLPDIWDGGGVISVGLQFEKFGAIVGTSYRGYVDSIQLQQIPEPAAWAQFGCGALLFVGLYFRQRCASL